jgi:hypothetical protein
MNKGLVMDDLKKNYSFHSPKKEDVLKYKDLRDKTLYLASVIMDIVPESRERSLALTKLEECLFWSNAGLARKE